MVESNTNVEMSFMSDDDESVGIADEGENSDAASATSSIFVDTNILAYAYDRSEKRKHGICQKLVRDAFEGESTTNLCLSNQILGELFVVLTGKVARPLTKEHASTIVRGYIDSPKWKKVNYDHSTVRRVLDDKATIRNTPFWDLLIAETMKDAGVDTLYTENTKDFQRVPWVKAINPVGYSKKPPTARNNSRSSLA